ncbi:ShlB/FhaC/HecB family hemolysin secretion/activation protein [Rubripirellula reticaptiva]|uniref:Heme/hemopexin transporter protein HuxB n=1 Tax=Rubripirellula reticaptiva TaxID=2528013 RepID=A0A5C6EEN8_9BACT|nr:ShlB/FhaC/HecB family hemolysin secretion/activation protein [Rubripirellula reticaptiva]TWU47130.1 Heme/hemopexin transporter protein HuxB precursor [Rubripirellula reticaptiva]
MCLSRGIQYSFALFAVMQIVGSVTYAQNYERYKPLDISNIDVVSPALPEQRDLPEAVEDDRILVESLEAVVIVDTADKIATDETIDDLEGIHYRFDSNDSLVHQSQVRSIVAAQIGQPITLRRINELTRDIIKQYRRCKQPIVDVVIPEQRVTGGTLHLVVIESRIGSVKVKPGCYFDCEEVSRWVECTKPGRKIYEPWIENDLLWMNQNAFRRVSVDFEKGAAEGTTDVIYSVKDQFPLRGYVGVDDSGVETLNYGRFFAGFQYGNLFGRGGTLGYQYTADESFSLLEAHSLSFTQPINRDYSFLTYGSWAGVSPMLDGGLDQNGESYQFGSTLTRHLEKSRTHFRNLTAGYEFKATNNNLEFAGSTISNSVADLFQLRFGYDDYMRIDADQFRSFNVDCFIGPGGGMTGSHSAAAFNTLRPGTSPDYVYGRMRYERADSVGRDWLLSSRFAGQASSERLLFSETLGLGGFDTLRGTDQRAYNADHGWIANFEFGPKTYRWGCQHDPRTFRAYTFVDMGNGYVADPIDGEDAYTFALSTGVGARFQISDRLIARFDYGIGIQDIADNGRSDRAHFGLTWIPGRRLY